MNIKITILGLFLVSACCYKDDCPVGENQSIPFRFENFADEDIDSVKYFLLELTDGSIVDSGYNYHEDYLHPRIFLGRKNDLNNRLVVIKTAISSDTIRNIKYDIKIEKKPCGQCLFQKNTEQVVSNFRVEYKGIEYKRGDTLVITP